MKKLNAQLFKKLSSYSALASSFIALAQVSSSQIVYKDIKPDFTGTKPGDVYYLDLNGDSIIDYAIELATATFKSKVFNGLYLVADNFNEAVGGTWRTARSSYDFAFPSNLPQGSIIASCAQQLVNWKFQELWGFAGFESTNGQTYGNWKNVKDGYLGLKFYIQGKPHYGWARLDTKTSRDTIQFTIKDFAYLKDSADYCSGIQAGDTGSVATGISSVSQTDLSIFSYDKEVYILSSAEGNIRARVFDMAGREVKEFAGNRDQSHFSLANFPAGIYLITVLQDGIVKTKKISLK